MGHGSKNLYFIMGVTKGKICLEGGAGVSNIKILVFFVVLCAGIWAVAHWIEVGSGDKGLQKALKSGDVGGGVSWGASGVDDGAGALERINREQVALIQRALPSVVNITTLQPALMGDEFSVEGWEGEGMPQGPGMPDGQRMPSEEGLGAGVILEEDGYIITNAHVVKHALDIRVKLHDGRSVKASLVGMDDLTDVAVIKVELSGLKPMRVGNSDWLQLGEQVWALGNPFNFNSSVSRGIISGKNRSPQFTNNYEDFIQSDVVLNPGNSGGALINSRGEMIGINTAILSGSGSFQGMSFAIPINLAYRVYQEIRSGRKIRRGMLGCHLRPLRSEFVDFFKLDRDAGALVVDVVKGSSADRAGLRPMDIIIRYNGERVLGPGHLRFLVAQTVPGEKAMVDFIRADRRGEKGVVTWPEAQVEVVIEELEDISAKRSEEKSLASRDGLKNAIAKVQVVGLDADFRKRWAIPDTVDGLVVRQVVSNTAASEVLRLGDVIIGIEVQGGEGMRAYSLADFKRLQETLRPGQSLLFYLYRNHKFEFLVLAGE
jgi:serine protease Do